MSGFTRPPPNSLAYARISYTVSNTVRLCVRAPASDLDDDSLFREYAEELAHLKKPREGVDPHTGYSRGRPAPFELSLF